MSMLAKIGSDSTVIGRGSRVGRSHFEIRRGTEKKSGQPEQVGYGSVSPRFWPPLAFIAFGEGIKLPRASPDCVKKRTSEAGNPLRST
jgi:hypothetical protein